MAIPGLGPVVAAGWLVATLTGAGIGAAAGGLGGSLTGAGVSERDAHAYAEGVRRGGSLLTVRTDEGHAATAAHILEEHGAVDLDERADGWEREGWTGRTGDGARSDTSTLIGSDAAAGSPVRENAALSTPVSGTDTRLSARAVSGSTITRSEPIDPPARHRRGRRDYPGPRADCGSSNMGLLESIIGSVVGGGASQQQGTGANPLASS